MAVPSCRVLSPRSLGGRQLLKAWPPVTWGLDEKCHRRSPATAARRGKGFGIVVSRRLAHPSRPVTDALDVGFNEADTRAKLIDPKLKAAGMGRISYPSRGLLHPGTRVPRRR